MTVIARAALAAALVAFGTGAALAQDAVKVDQKHYKVLVDNAQVRVLRIHYGPHETSVRHAHPNSVVVYLTDGRMRMLLGNGKTIVATAKAGTSSWTPAGIHTPTNLENRPFDAVLVEMKGPGTRGKK
jgi:quercetin dioxygenase-like cupin family protein